MIRRARLVRAALFLQVGFAAGLPVAAGAEPEGWRMQDASTITFVAVQAGAPFQGRFERFKAQILFSEDALEDSVFLVEIDLASVASDYGERDEILRGPEFLNVGAQQLAVYRATSFTHLGGGEYRADGELSLNKRQLPVPITFTFAPAQNENDRRILQGDAELNRLDFAIGLGDWADEKWIGHRVQVQFTLRLTGNP